MSRRNATHLSKLARIVARELTIPYAAALARCRRESAAGRLATPLDADGLARSAARIIAAYGPHRARTSTGDAPAADPAQSPTAFLLGHPSDAWAGDTEPVMVHLQDTLRHTLISGAAGTGKTVAAATYALGALAGGWDVLHLGFERLHSDVIRRAEELGTRVRQVGDVTDVDEIVGGLAWEAAAYRERTGSVERMRTILDTLSAHRFGYPAARPPLMVIVDGLDFLLEEVALLLRTARSFGIAIVVLTQRGPAGLPLGLTHNVGSLVVLRTPERFSALEYADLLDGDRRPELAEALRALATGTGQVRGVRDAGSRHVEIASTEALRRFEI